MRVGGFPEPFFADDPIEAARWRRERYERFVKEDIRDLEAVKDLQTLSFYAELLKERVRWPIALSNLAADLEVAPATAKHWLGVFEAMHYVFVCRPFTYKLSRSVHKQPKVYFFDNAEVPDQAARLENLVATHLLKRVHFLQDALGLDGNLHFLRDKEGREVDFAITRGRRVEELYEAKVSDRNPDPNLLYYARKLRPRACYQVVGDLDKSFVSQDVRFVSPSELFDQPLSTLVQVFGAS
jgi:predicted AAA+ superfamily ATPase